MKTTTVKNRYVMQNVETYEGETIEQKVARIIDNGEPIEDGAPIIYTEKKNGVNPASDVRTDRWDLAIEAMDIVTRERIARNEENQKGLSGLANEQKKDKTTTKESEPNVTNKSGVAEA